MILLGFWEFAIVTVLPCGKFPSPPSKLKLKETISEKSYRPTLFGKGKIVTVSTVIKIFRKNTVKEKEIRLKFACLAILSSVLLLTKLRMKISKEHAESIEDSNSLHILWGRFAYDMLMSSIKERNEISLSQKTIAVRTMQLLGHW